MSLNVKLFDLDFLSSPFPVRGWLPISLSPNPTPRVCLFSKGQDFSQESILSQVPHPEFPKPGLRMETGSCLLVCLNRGGWWGVAFVKRKP